jgi:hypothetical protein
MTRDYNHRGEHILEELGKSRHAHEYPERVLQSTFQLALLERLEAIVEELDRIANGLTPRP